MDLINPLYLFEKGAEKLVEEVEGLVCKIDASVAPLDELIKTNFKILIVVLDVSHPALEKLETQEALVRLYIVLVMLHHGLNHFVYLLKNGKILVELHQLLNDFLSFFSPPGFDQVVELLLKLEALRNLIETQDDFVKLSHFASKFLVKCIVLIAASEVVHSFLAQLTEAECLFENSLEEVLAVDL
jgi:hypothetical protein